MFFTARFFSLQFFFFLNKRGSVLIYNSSVQASLYLYQQPQLSYLTVVLHFIKTGVKKKKWFCFAQKTLS